MHNYIYSVTPRETSIVCMHMVLDFVLLPKSYLWQPVVTSPVIQQRMEEPLRSDWGSSVCYSDC